MTGTRISAVLTGVAAILVCACAPRGPQSAFLAQGQEAERISHLFWVMVGGSVALLVFVLAALASALIGGPVIKRLLASERMIIAAGIGLPIVVLTALLFYGFAILAGHNAVADASEPLEIEVVGERWWWRVRYRDADGSVIETANELRVPVGRSVRLLLTSADVIHSFWVPALAGKVDMVPGRTNTLTLDAREPGIYRGQCAEYCGGPHALMSFFVVAEPPETFAAWLAGQGADAVDTGAGSTLFIQSGCGGCHAIRGTEAAGAIGPDLTHIGGRLTIGAGVLRTSADALALWIRSHRELKPDNAMPPFDGLSETESAGLAAYLAALD